MTASSSVAYFSRSMLGFFMSPATPRGSYQPWMFDDYDALDEHCNDHAHSVFTCIPIVILRVTLKRQSQAL